MPHIPMCSKSYRHLRIDRSDTTVGKRSRKQKISTYGTQEITMKMLVTRFRTYEAGSKGLIPPQVSTRTSPPIHQSFAFQGLEMVETKSEFRSRYSLQGRERELQPKGEVRVCFGVGRGGPLYRRGWGGGLFTSLGGLSTSLSMG